LYEFYKEEIMKNRTRTSSKRSSDKRKEIQLKRYAIKAAKIIIMFCIFMGCIVGGLVGGVIAGSLKTATPITEDQLKLTNLTTIVYDKDGNVISELTRSENRVLVDYDQIPQYLKDAFVSIEDERFMDHDGIDIIGLARAFFKKITNPTKPMQGASTITQQVIKNLTGDDERSIKRKVQEQWRAIQLEKRLAKWEILELYMNLVCTGQNIYGVQAAAQTYFNKDVSELSLAECASIAGITNNPSLYNPFTTKGRENNKKRQEIILGKMLELGKITREEYEQAMQEELKFVEGSYSEVVKINKQNYFVDQVVLDVKKALMAQGMSEEAALNRIYNNGLKIYTTMDSNVQKAMEQVYTDPANYRTGAADNSQPQSGMAVIDPTNGHVRGLVGGFGEKVGSPLNRSTQIARSAGSSFKPIAVYGPAINEKLITASYVVDDAPVYMLGEEYGPYPTNFDYTYHGLVTIREAIKQSLNVVAAKVWRDILTPEKSLEYLAKVGIKRTQTNISLALGQLQEGVSPLTMAAAYVPFANRGLYFKPITFTRVEDQYGNVIVENKTSSPTIVYDEAAAYIMADMLKAVVGPGGTASSIGGGIRNAKGELIATAGKTGTSSDNKDKWFVGFTPYYTAAVWYGYDDNRDIPSSESGKAIYLWNKVMTLIHQNLDAKDFEEPLGIVKGDVCIRSGKYPNNLCHLDPMDGIYAIRYGEIYIKGTEPKEEDKCTVHVSKKVCTESQDAYGRNLLAGPYCPSSSVVEKVMIHRSGQQSSLVPDFIYDYSVDQVCNVHTHGSSSSSNSNRNNNSGNSSKNNGSGGNTTDNADDADVHDDEDEDDNSFLNRLQNLIR